MLVSILELFWFLISLVGISSMAINLSVGKFFIVSMTSFIFDRLKHERVFLQIKFTFNFDVFRISKMFD